MSKIKNSGLDQYGAEPFEQEQFGAAGVEGVKVWFVFLLTAALMLVVHRIVLVLYTGLMVNHVVLGSRVQHYWRRHPGLWTVSGNVESTVDVYLISTGAESAPLQGISWR